MSDLGKISVTNEGDWNASTPYEINTMVRHNGATYMSLKDSTGQEPSEENTEYWMLVSKDGTTPIIDDNLSSTSTNPIQNKVVKSALDEKLSTSGDSKDVVSSFSSNDSTSETTIWTDVPALNSSEKHSSIFNKISTMFKNIRYLYKMLGTADISTLGEGADIGTVTGALSKLNSDFESLDTKKYVSVCEYVDVEYTDEGAKIFVPFPYANDVNIYNSIGFSADGVNEKFNGDERMLASITQKTRYGFFATFTGDLVYVLQNILGSPNKIYVGYRGYY